MTTDRATLLALASKVEAATGPDRMLDAEIFYSLRPSLMRLGSKADWLNTDASKCCPGVTASLDAALSLVPEGWVTADANNLNIPSNNGGWAWALDNGEDCGHPRFRDAVAKARTPALALTAAALRALAQEAPKK